MLRGPPASDLDNRRNKKCEQGQHEYDLRGGECRCGGNAKAERACDQTNDKKSDCPAKHRVPLRAARVYGRLNVSAPPMFRLGAAYVRMNQPPLDRQEYCLRASCRVEAGTMTTLTAFTGYRNSNQGELACPRKLIPRRRNITKTPRKAIGLLPNITAKVNTPRVTRNRRKRRATRRPPASIPTSRTARANRTSKRKA